jgi:transposase-like protein
LTNIAPSLTWLKELGVVEQTLGNWVRQERVDRGEKEGLSKPTTFTASGTTIGAQSISA